MSSLGVPQRDGNHRAVSGSARTAGPRRTGGGFSAGDALADVARGAGGRLLSEAVGGAASGFGRADVSIGFGTGGRPTGRATLSVPVFDREDGVLFVQTGLNAPSNGRVLAHLGLVRRFYPTEGWAFGVNAFADQDVLRGHSRGGVGFEAWRDYLRASLNFYAPVTGWKTSGDYGQAREKPAAGYDLRLRAYVPGHPELSLEAGYERWPGGHSGVLSKDRPGASRRGAFSWGLAWTPTPMATVRLAGSPGPDLRREVRAELGFNLTLGKSVQESGGAGDAAAARGLAGSRLMPVERDYDMPLRYLPTITYRFLLLGKVGGNEFKFRVTDYFGDEVPGLGVAVGVGDPGVLVADPASGQETGSFVTDRDGEIVVRYEPQNGQDSVETTLSAGPDEGGFTLPLDRADPTPARAVTVYFMGTEPDSVYVFQARHDDDDSPAAGHKVRVTTLSGTPVLDPADDGPSSVYLSDQGGYVRVRLAPPPGLAGDTVVTDPEDGGPTEHPVAFLNALTLTASPLVLDYLGERAVDFALALDGEPLPEGTLVELDSAPGRLSGLPEKSRSVSGGVVPAPALKALTPSGPIVVSARAMGLTSNAVSLEVGLKDSDLRLEASRTDLVWLEPRDVGFAVTYKGEPLAAGTAVSLDFDPARLAGLDSPVETGPGGTFRAPGLKALDRRGPLPVSAGFMGLVSNREDFSVTLAPGGLTLESDRQNLRYLEPLETRLTVGYLGEPLPQGSEVTLNFDSSELGGLEAGRTVGADGEILVPALTALRQAGPLNVSAVFEGVGSAPVSFGVGLDQGALGLAADRSDLYYLEGSPTRFRVTYLGENLPPGSLVAVHFDAGELSGLAAEYELDARGTFESPSLAALKTAGPLSVTAGFAGLRSNPAVFSVALRPGGLSLAADRSALDFLKGRETVFTVKYLGSPLPAGSLVSVGFGAGDLSGLEQNYALAAGGVFISPGLTALKPLGPLPVTVGFLGLTSDPWNFAVDLDPDGLTLSSDRNGLDFLEARGTTFTVRYLGEPLAAGSRVSVYFDASGLSGLEAGYALGAGGVFVSPGLTALRPAGPLPVSVGFLGAVSNDWEFGVALKPGALTLGADRETLDFLEPGETAFTVRYLGEPLAAGSRVSVDFDASELSGLEAGYALGAGGVFVSPELKALKPLGPLPVAVGFQGLVSEPRGFGVALKAGGLGLAVDRTELPYLEGAAAAFQVTYLGTPVPAGTVVAVNFDPVELGGLAGSQAVAAGGGFDVAGLTALKPSGPLPVSVSAWGLTSGARSFGVTLDQAGLQLATPTGGLEYLVPTAVGFEVTYKGAPLPAGTPLTPGYREGALGGIPGTVVSGGGGFTLGGLAALEPAGPLDLRVGLPGLWSNHVSFDVWLEPGHFGFSADPAEVELHRPTKVTFGFTYRGEPLPPGVGVGLGGLPGDWENLPASLVTGPLGEAVAPSLTALRSRGPLPVAGHVGGEWAGEEALGVLVRSEGLSASAVIDPYFPAEDGGADDADGRPTLLSCKVYDYRLTVSYLGRPLDKETVGVAGFGYSPAGLSQTDSQGRLAGTIYYSLLDQELHLDVGDDYVITLGGASLVHPGPLPVEFHGCH
ncbi:MAG: inverse autotransporter beta domain-containing protein [Deltaproteobacteria bacterium]|nr:inverse autotransporter beta domain-containing protein [Deltaproteobacteria bacterium]